MNRLYISIGQRNCVKHEKVLLSDIAQLITKDMKLATEVGNIQVADLHKEKLFVLDIVAIIRMIENVTEDVDIVNLGESEFILELTDEKKINRFFEYMKVTIVCIIVFLGSAFSIMTFNKDSSIVEIFKDVYFLFTKSENIGPPVVEISYSIGLTLGILLFYNHIFKRGKQRDPTPMQIEMREFEKDVNETIIINADRKDSS